MTRTLLYFGSFNPIHIGHLAIANYAMISGIADELWFVVSSQNPFKSVDALAPAEHRVAMVRLAVEQTGMGECILVTDIELRLPLPSYTIRTLEALWEEYPDREFAILMGSDNLADIAKWKEPERILDRCKIYIYERPNMQGNKILYNNSSVHRLPGVPLLTIDSTSLREWLAAGKPIPALLPHGVYDYIKTHGLYRIDC